MRSRRLALLFPALAAALVLSALLGLAMGSARLGFGEVAQALVGKGGETARLIVWQLRLPRVAGALLAGAGLRVLEGGPYDHFEHWVEQAVTRDIAVAVRP